MQPGTSTVELALASFVNYFDSKLSPGKEMEDINMHEAACFPAHKKLVGGPEESYEAAKPLFQAMGKYSTYCGSSGNGVVKDLRLAMNAAKEADVKCSFTKALHMYTEMFEKGYGLKNFSSVFRQYYSSNNEN